MTTRRKFLQSLGGAAALTASGVLPGPAGADPLPAAKPTALTTHEHVRRLAKVAPLSMRFDGGTAAELAAWRERFRSKLASLLGDYAPPERWETTAERTDELTDHTRLQLLLSAKGHATLPVYLLLPRGAAGRKRPGVVAVHGHGSHGYHPIVGRDDLPGVSRAIAGANYDYGRQLVRQGYVVAAPCLQPFGRRLGSRDRYGRQDPCAVEFLRLQLLGKVLMAENLRDVLWSLALLCQRPEVDADRCACVGLSYGGRMTMLAAAMESRFKVAVISGAMNVMQERVQVRYSCGAQVIPGLLRYGDVPEIGSLIAPRPAVWEIGSRDKLVKSTWANAAIARLKRAYKACGKPENLVIDRFEGGHRFHGKRALEVMQRELMTMRSCVGQAVPDDDYSPGQQEEPARFPPPREQQSS